MSSGTNKKAQAKKKKSKLRAPDDPNELSSEEKRRRKFLSRFFTAMFVIPGFFGALITIWGYFSPPFTTISLDDSVQLKNVFFGGNPWLLTCEPYKGQEVNSIFSGLSSLGSGQYKLGVINCELPMPASGKTIIERFKLNKQKKYSRNNLAFTVANGGKPKVVPSFYFSALNQQNNKKKKKKKKQLDTGTLIKNLDEYVTKKVSVRYGKVINGAQLTKQCLSKGSAGIVLVEGEPSLTTTSTIERLAQTYRTVWFCVVDRTKYSFSLEKKFPQLKENMEDGDGKLILFRKKKQKKITESEDEISEKKGSKKKKDDILMVRQLNEVISTSTNVMEFMEKTMAKQDGYYLMEALRKKPTLRYRKKGGKNKNKNKNKKNKNKKDKKDKSTKTQKKENRPKRKKKATPPPPSDTAANSDTSDNKPTREQLEKEAQRRRRMDQEAQAHYAQAADNDEEDYDDDVEEDDEVEVYEEEEEEDDDVDDEDTIEL